MASTRIGVAVFPDAEELDWAGPWEVLAVWSRLSVEGGIDMFTVATDPVGVRCAGGVRIVPDRTWDDIGEVDVLVYPGGQGTRRQLEDDELHGRLRRLAADGALMTSVCTGALVYAAAGLLRGRPATTHWKSLDLLASLDPSLELRPDERFVDDGDVITSAGVSAGIDMALHLVARLGSPGQASDVRRHIQYDPQPPV